MSSDSSNRLNYTFIDDPSPDVVIRSCDKIDFYVLKAILAHASPFFKGMFELPVPVTSEPSVDFINGIPISLIEENVQIWNDLLCLVYPSNRPPRYTPSAIETIYATVLAARNYEVEEVEFELKEVLARFSESCAVIVFAIAVRMGWVREAKIAAQHTLKLPPLSLPSNTTQSLKCIQVSIRASAALVEYRRRCADAASGSFQNLRWVLTEIHDRPSEETRGPHPRAGMWCQHHVHPFAWVWMQCSRCPGHHEEITPRKKFPGDVFTPRLWWRGYLDRVAHALQNTPAGSVTRETEQVKLTLRKAAACSFCAEKAFDGLDEFSRHLEKKINSAICQVQIELTGLL